MDFVYKSLLKDSNTGADYQFADDAGLGRPYSFANQYLPYDDRLISHSTPYAADSPQSAFASRPQEKNKSASHEDFIPYNAVGGSLNDTTTPYAAATPYKALAGQPKKNKDATAHQAATPYNAIAKDSGDGLTPYAAATSYNAVSGNSAETSTANAANAPYETVGGKPEYQKAQTGTSRDQYYYQDAPDIDGFTTHVINGHIPRLERGNLGLVAVQV